MILRSIIFTILITAIIITPFNILKAEQSKSTISGTIRDIKSGEVVIGASIGVYKDTNTRKASGGAISNKYGFYSIPKVVPGDYYIIANSIGYNTYIKKVRLEENKDLTFSIKVSEKEILTKEVVVEGNRTEDLMKPISEISISPIFITKLPSIGGEVDVFRALQLLPGVKQASEISSGLYVRGGSPDQNLILLDGVVVYNPSHLGGFLSSFNGDALRDINLIKGAFPAEYGGRISSVLDMTMKEGSKEKFSGKAGISVISSQALIEGPITDKSSFMISARRMYLDLILALVPKDKTVPPSYYFYDLNAKINYDIGDNDRLFLSGYLGADVLKSPTQSKNVFGVDWGNKTANLRWMHIASPNLFTNFSLIYTNYNFETSVYDTSNAVSNFSSLSQIEDYMLRAETQYFPTNDHTIKAGFEITQHSFSVDAKTEFLPGIKLNIASDSAIKSIESAFYIQDDWLITPLIGVNIGARAYYFQEGNYFNVEPRLSINYALTDKMNLKIAGAEATQFLHLITRNDISLPTDIWFPSTSNIKPSTSLQGSIGIDSKMFDDEIYTSFEVYYKKMENLYEYKDSAKLTFGIPLESQFTNGWGESYGGELFINKRIGNFTGWVGYTLSWTKRYFDELNNGKPFFPRYDIRHDISIVANFELSKNWEIGATWVYYSGQTYTVPAGSYNFSPIGWGSQVGEQTPYSSKDKQKFIYTERNGYRMEPYHKMDVNLMYKFEWFKLPFQLSINIYNVYNRLNPFAVYIDTKYDAKGNPISKEFKQITLFPFIPSLALSCKF
jgi:hypothetical protein